MRIAAGLALALATCAVDASEAASIAGKTIRSRWTEYAYSRSDSSAPPKVRRYENTIYVGTQGNVYSFDNSRGGDRFAKGDAPPIPGLPDSSAQHSVSGATLTRVFSGSLTVTTITYTATGPTTCSIAMGVQAKDGTPMPYIYRVQVQLCRLTDGPPRQARR